MSETPDDEKGHMEDADSAYPEARSVSDWLLPASRGVVGSVPFVGGILSEVIGFVWIPSLHRRQVEWLRGLGERVEDLSGRVEGFEERLTSDAVLTAAVSAMRSAVASHEEAKREALRAAVLNTALEVEPDESMRIVFMTMIDRLSAAHLQMLTLLDAPREYFERREIPPPEFSMSSSLSALIKAAFPNWDSDLIAQVARDIDQQGLANASHLGTMMTAGGAFEQRSTDLGRRFIRFITEPI